jgi:outer membrane protein
VGKAIVNAAHRRVKTFGNKDGFVIRCGGGLGVVEQAIANQDPNRILPPGFADCGNAGSDGPPLTHPIEKRFGERHMRVEAWRALRQVRDYVLEDLKRDRLVARVYKTAIKCRLEATVDRLAAAVPVSIDAVDYGFRNRRQTIARNAVSTKLAKALGLTWTDIIGDIQFAADIGRVRASLPRAFEHPKTLDIRPRRKICPVVAAIASAVAVVTLPTDPSPCRAETMSGALARAYWSNPDLNRQRAAVRATDQTLPGASAGWRPKATATGRFGYNYLDLISPSPGALVGGIPVQTSARLRAGTDPGTLGLTVTENLFNGNRTVNGVRQAESNIFGARETLRNTEQNVLLSAAESYMNVLRDTDILDLHKNNVLTLEELVHQTRERFKIGEVTQTDVDQAGSSLASGREGFFTAQANLHKSDAGYRRVIGVAPSRLEPARSIEKLLPRTLRAAVALALAEHPAIQAALHAVDAAVLQVKLVEGELYPTVNVVGSVEQDYNLSGIPRERLFNGFAGGQVSVPIYEGGEVYAHARQAKEVLGEARLQADLQRDMVRESVVSSWSELESARASVETLKAAVKLAESALDSVRKEAKMGQRTTFDILQQQQIFVNARMSLATAQRDHVVASYSVMAAIGRLSAQNLNLPVTLYDPTVHFDQVKDKWIGLGTPEGR